jgi:hypothetical protein
MARTRRGKRSRWPRPHKRHAKRRGWRATRPSWHHLPAMRQPQVSGQPSAHQIGEIVAIIMWSGKRRGAGQRRGEALERITFPFDVRDSRRRTCRFEVSRGHNVCQRIVVAEADPLSLTVFGEEKEVGPKCHEAIRDMRREYRLRIRAGARRPGDCWHTGEVQQQLGRLTSVVTSLALRSISQRLWSLRTPASAQLLATSDA